MTNLRIAAERELPTPANGPGGRDVLDVVKDLQDRLESAAIQIRSARHENYAGALPSSSDITFELKSARRLRQLRKSLFGPDLYSGPAWELLLQLFESYLLQRRETIGSATIGAELSGTTGLRWMNRLGEDGLVQLSTDQHDGRRRFAELTEAGIALMINYFSGAAPQLVAA